MTQTLGTMRHLDPRDLWPEEADFTRWMAWEEGVDLLGDAVGMKLVCVGLEFPAGQFRADIVCYDESNLDHTQTVVIENQLGPSDHDHLGKTLTYSAELEADACIWVATRFEEEHLHAVHALNYPEDRVVDYFCVKLSVAQIDDSAPAPRFDTLVGPSSWRPWEGEKTRAETDETIRERFWEVLDEELARRGLNETIVGKNLSYRRFDIGFPGVAIYLNRDSEGARAGLRIYRMQRGIQTGEEYYRRLQSERRTIEREIDEPVTWRRPNDRLNAVELSTESHVDDKSKWEGEVDWMIQSIEKLENVLRPRLGTPLTR